MIVEYKKMARISTILCIAGFAFIIFIMPPTGNVWDSGNVFQIAIVSMAMAAFWIAFWSYAKAKGYSGAVGIALPFLSIIGLLILLSLRDKTLSQHNAQISRSPSDTGIQYRCIDCNKIVQESELINDGLFCPTCRGHVDKI